MTSHTLIETFTHEGVRCEIHADEHADNPYQTFEQASGLVFGYPLAREYDWSTERIDFDLFVSVAHAARYLTLVSRFLVAIPFRVDDYGSGGIRVYLTDTDDGRVAGFVVVSQAHIDATGALDPEDAARQDFETFRQWVEGEVYGYVVAPGTASEESCWGFYGAIEYVREEAGDNAEYVAEQWRSQFTESAPEYVTEAVS